MPCIVDDYYSCKIVSRNVNNKPCISGNILLYNIKNSNLLCNLDCRWITSNRTAAVAALTTECLAISNFKNIVLVGLGECSYYYLKYLINIFQNNEFNIHLIKYKNHCENFKK